jgi:hypothetical protein
MLDEAGKELLSIVKTENMECAYNNTIGVRISAKFNRVDEKGWMHCICSVHSNGMLSTIISSGKGSFN